MGRIGLISVVVGVSSNREFDSMEGFIQLAFGMADKFQTKDWVAGNEYRCVIPDRRTKMYPYSEPQMTGINGGEPRRRGFVVNHSPV